MNKYQIYFYIESKELYKDIEDSKPKTDLEELKILVPQLNSENDSISIYTTESRIRIMIWGASNGQTCTLEINNSQDGVNYYKDYKRDDLSSLTSEDLEGFLADPKKNGFQFESF